MVIPILFAQAYGQGLYGCGQYSVGCQSGGTTQIGPITLPVTGAGLTAIISAIIIACGAGLYVWARQRRKRTSNKPGSSPSA